MARRHALLTLIPLALTLAVSTCVHLPAVRNPVEKRTLASRLLRSADTHKRRSLRDVLAEHPGRDAHQRPGRAAAGAQARGGEPAVERAEARQRDLRARDERRVFRTVSELFAWAIQHTTRNLSLSISAETTSSVLLPEGTHTNAAHVARLPRPRAAQTRSLPPRPAVAADIDNVEHITTTEFDELKRSLRVIQTGSPVRQTRALRIVEELCHSVDNGRDVQITGGITVLVEALDSSHSSVRANSAWALATCSQNNPVVQNASLAAGAIPRLSYLAARDRSTVVRAKALFALNAVLEFTAAREAFERLPLAIHAIRNALLEGENTRATRRALNLTELLARRNLDAWKTSLEAWDVPGLVERILRTHPDGDVRESAARTIAALDGRAVP